MRENVIFLNMRYVITCTHDLNYDSKTIGGMRVSDHVSLTWNVDIFCSFNCSLYLKLDLASVPENCCEQGPRGHVSERYSEM